MNADTNNRQVPRTLVADDHPDVLTALQLLLKSQGWQVQTVTSPGEVIAALTREKYDLLLLDLNYARDTTSGREGLDLLSQVRALDNTLPVVAMTAWGSIELAVTAMQKGVTDFIQKPWDNERLLSVLDTQIQAGRLRRDELRAQEAEELLHKREFEAAREIQSGLVPGELPELDGYEIAAAWQPAHEVGGDYFDVLQFDRRYVAICIGDAMGKGMPAALLMANVQAMVRSMASREIPAGELCSRINRELCRNVSAGRFMTFFYCLLDTESGTLTYSNAGHNAPMLVRRQGKRELLTTGGAVPGILTDSRYEQGEVQLDPGDRLILFTDGITEVRNFAGEEFGEDELLELPGRLEAQDAQSLQKAIMQAVSDFCDGDFVDDATLIVLTRR